jgi:hypothetical protein
MKAWVNRLKLEDQLQSASVERARSCHGNASMAYQDVFVDDVWRKLVT